eukprot:8804417-Pyramimonas_sp.AAC.2
MYRRRRSTNSPEQQDWQGSFSTTRPWMTSSRCSRTTSRTAKTRHQPSTLQTTTSRRMKRATARWQEAERLLEAKGSYAYDVGAGLFYGHHHSRNSKWAIQGPAQNAQRAEVRAALRWAAGSWSKQ